MTRETLDFVLRELRDMRSHTPRARKSVALRLSRTLRRLLERNRKLSLRLTLKVSDPAGHTRTLRKKVSLRLENP